jgi:hypothetical protein
VFPGQNLREVVGSGFVPQVVKHLPSKHKTLSSNSRIRKKNGGSQEVTISG